ncbi:bacillithiol system protein YtxJ [Flexibacter flexilis DSM 6793]|uniref:Bacillithiol system protein YtxJ n=1 Tax=Flexibacter flexilis DSM 6793 TaxID=927664 RepID=A0A1I1K3N1_9BACT|nr:bacillithiol system redox-active protein YtxJ [Flexibacter flexilis]SFC55464.1 bacillithiol system protein YtxJ [Flexibacter flexilis DSM 6793]
MNWIALTAGSTLEQIQKDSAQQPILIFKHSTRCSISATALSRLERAWQQGDVANTQTYLLDLIAYREISNQIAQVFGIGHESPQILLIRNGQCVFDASHWDIDYQDIKQKINA